MAADSQLLLLIANNTPGIIAKEEVRLKLRKTAPKRSLTVGGDRGLTPYLNEFVEIRVSKDGEKVQ